MAVTTKVIRVANPRKSGRGRFRLRTNRRKTNARRKMSPKQIRIFGTPQQKAALKRKRKAKRTKNPKASRRRSSSRPKVKVIYRTRTRKKVRRRRANPGLVVTLGSINPRKRRKSVATKRKRSRRRATNARRHRRTRKATNVRRRRARRTRNPRRVYVMNPPRRRRSRRRVHHSRKHRRMNSRRRRNPQLFGRSSAKDMLTLVGGGLAGVWATKIATSYVTPMVSSIGATAGLGSFMPIIISGVSAWALGFLAGKMNKELGEAVLFGGLMQTGSVALNAFVPSIGSQISLGDLMNGNFVVPQNPVLMGNQMAAMSAPAARMSSAYGSAY